MKRTQFFTLTQKVRILLLLCCMLAGAGQAWAVNNATWVNIADVDPSDDYTFVPSAGTVSDLSTIQVTTERDIVTASDYNSITHGYFEVDVVMPRLIRDGYADITAQEVTSTNQKPPFTITFQSPIPDGEYTLVIPEGTFWHLNGIDSGPIPEMRVNYTLQTQASPGAWKVIITGAKRADEKITYRNRKRLKTQEPSKLASDELEATVGDGEYFIFKDGITEGDLLDCDFTSSAASRTNGTSFVYGPVIDWENHTITCEIREAITAKPTTAGWYQLKWDVSTNNVAADTRHTTGAREDEYTNPTRDANRFYITMPREGIGSSGYYLNYNTYPTDDTAPLTFVKLVPSGNNLMMMTIDGRFVKQDGTPLTSGSGYANPVAYVDGELDFQLWFPFGNGSNPTYFLGKASNTHNYFYTAPAKFDDDRYEFYEVKFEPDNVLSNPFAHYKGSATNYSMTDVYQNGYFVFPKGHIPTVADFDVTGVTFTNMTIDIKGTGNVKTLTFKEFKATLNGTINLKFVDNGDHDLRDAKVKFVPSEGDAVVLSSEQTTYEFNSADLSTCKFRSAGDYNLIRYNYNDESKTLTFTLGVPEWFFVKSNYDSNSGYLSSDYKDGSGYYQRNTNTKPTNYAGIWRKESVVGNGYNLINAKYLYSQILTTTGDSEAHYMQLDPVSSLRSGAYYELTDERQSNGETFLKYINESNMYFGISANYWVRRTKPGDRSSYLTITRAEVMGKSVTVSVLDNEGNAYAPGAIFQTQCEDPAFPHERLTIQNGTKVDFHNMPFLSSLFSVDDADKIIVAAFDESEQILTLMVKDDPNVLRFSSAPVDGVWASDTKWFTWRNNRSNQGGYNQKYITTSATGTTDDLNLYVRDLPSNTLEGTRGEYWCFVGDNEHGFYIMNAAYGPDFCLANVSGNKFQMVPKDNIPNGATALFTYGDQSTQKDGASVAYMFRVGITGDARMHVDSSSDLHKSSGMGAINDTGASFKVTFAEVSSSLPTYDVYKVEWGIRNKDVNSITYGGSGVFGKRGTPSDGAYMIVEHDTKLTAANFTDDTTPSHTMANVSSREVSGHAYRLLVLDMMRPVRVTLPQTSYTMTMGASMEVPAYTVTDNAGESLLEGVTTTAHYTSDNASVVIDGISMRGVSAGSANISVTDFSFNALGTQYYYTDDDSFTGATATVTVNPGVMTVRFSEPNVMLVTDEDDTADVKLSGRVNFTGTDAITQLVIEPAAAIEGATIESVTPSESDKIAIAIAGDKKSVTLTENNTDANLTLTFRIASTGYQSADVTLNVRVLNNSDIVTAKQKRQEMADKPVGGGLGRYTYTGANYDGKSGNEAYNAAYAKFTEYCNKMYSYSDADIVKYCAEINTFCTNLNSHLTLNMPVPGKTLLRAKGKSGKYISGAVTPQDNNSTTRVSMIDNSIPANTILYYTKDKQLIGYVNGLGFNDIWCYASVGGAKDVDEFSQYGTIENNPGKYSIATSYGSPHDDNSSQLNRCTKGSDHDQHAWTLEDVTELPVTIGTTGYATLCSPVALTVPYGVEAYVDVERKAPNNGISVIKLQKLNGVIPANTAVVLRGREGNYNFRVTTSSYDIAIEGAENGGWTNNVVMQGTYPTLAADVNKYTLQKKSDAINFYPNSSSAQLKPFRVFIPTEPGAAKVQMFMMDFGGDLSMVLDTTIDTSEPSAPAYDLSGRMMQPTHRGIYLQQGRKVLVH